MPTKHDNAISSQYGCQVSAKVAGRDAESGVKISAQITLHHCGAIYTALGG